MRVRWLNAIPVKARPNRASVVGSGMDVAAEVITPGAVGRDHTAYVPDASSVKLKFLTRDVSTIESVLSKELAAALTRTSFPSL